MTRARPKPCTLRFARHAMAAPTTRPAGYPSRLTTRCIASTRRANGRRKPNTGSRVKPRRGRSGLLAAFFEDGFQFGNRLKIFGPACRALDMDEALQSETQRFQA